uniref:thioredoxin-dependent peroxiredoxin n=1 Tax=Megaselia scalaris TaxID=36166 RepID=T1GL40_MEGSC
MENDRFSDRVKEFKDVGCEVITCPTDIMKIARDYGVLDEECGVPFRGLFIIEGKQNLRQVPVNDLQVARNGDGLSFPIYR